MVLYTLKLLKKEVIFQIINLTNLGNRGTLIETDFEDILPEDLQQELKEVAQLSMGSDITEMDEKYIKNLAD